MQVSEKLVTWIEFIETDQFLDYVSFYRPWDATRDWSMLHHSKIAISFGFSIMQEPSIQLWVLSGKLSATFCSTTSIYYSRTLINTCVWGREELSHIGKLKKTCIQRICKCTSLQRKKMGQLCYLSPAMCHAWNVKILCWLTCLSVLITCHLVF